MDAKELGAQAVSAGQPLGGAGMPIGAYEYGLTKRELFAAMVMQGIAADQAGIKSYEWMAETCVKWADALLAELAKGQP